MGPEVKDPGVWFRADPCLFLALVCLKAKWGSSLGRSRHTDGPQDREEDRWEEAREQETQFFPAAPVRSTSHRMGIRESLKCLKPEGSESPLWGFPAE